MNFRFCYLISLAFFLTCFYSLPAQTPTNLIKATYKDINDNSSDYSEVGTGNNSYSSGTTYNLTFSSTSTTDNNLVLDYVRVGTDTLYMSNKLATPKFRRNNNATWSGTIEFIFFEENTFSSPNLDLKPEYVGTMEEALNSNIINRGTDNVFVNDDSNNGNNIERMDYVYLNGVTPVDNTKEGFLLVERNGNDNLRVAAILSINGSGDPTSFGSLLAVPSGGSYWGSSSYNITTITFRDNNSGAPSNLLPNETVGSQNVKGCFISINDLGVSNGTTFYGYALFGYDTPSGTSSANLLDWTNATYFPTNTASSNGGSDLIAGGVFVTLLDSDFDGIPNSTDLDDDNDGIPDSDEGTGDSDGDGLADLLDLDSDDDGIPDIIEAGGVDTNGDGWVDNLTDTDGDGLVDIYDTDNSGIDIPNPDTDGDGIKDAYDLDADGDGIPDLVEAGGIDTDGDGRVDVDMTDIANDSDRDGFADIYDPDDDGFEGIDSGEGTAPLALTTDSNADGRYDAITDGDAATLDKDGDGYADYLDLDADQDGIPDIVEAKGIDSDGDGRVDATTDADGDGLADRYDSDASDGPSGSGTDGSALVQTDGTDTDGDYKADDAAIIFEHGDNTALDTDGDGLPDYLDLDADNDGIPDLIEAGGIDTNGNGMVDASTDVDEDGLADVYDEDASDGPGSNGTNGTALIETSADSNSDGILNSTESMQGGGANAVDAEGDGIANHLDLDADNDGIPDAIESGGVDANGDGIADGYTDADNDGFSDVYDPTDNDSGAGNDAAFTAQANNPVVRSNSDGDSNGIVNGSEGYAEGDLEDDGYPNYLDIDADNDGILDIVEADGPSADANGDGYVDDYNPGTGTFGGSGDADNDGYSNEYDSDTDNNAVVDNAQSLNSGAWVSGPLILTGADTDVDGLPDSYGNGDTDSDIHPDFIDVDTDNDGILDNIEAQATGQAGTQAYVPNVSTVDSKGVPTAYGTYTNYDTDNSTSLGTSYGINPYDHDGDGTPDYKDTDSDDDGDPDVDEAWDSNLDGNGTSDYACTTDVDGDGLLSCFDTDDSDDAAITNANNPPVDNGFESSINNGATAASSFGSMNGTSVFYYDVFPNNNGDQGDIQPDWRDVGCAIGAGLQYPITGTDAIYNGSSHAAEPTKQVGAIRATDYCDGLVTAGWRYYFDPVNPTKVLFSIQHGSNTTQIDYIEMRRDTSSGRRVKNVGTGYGYFVMPRDWFVQTVDDAALTAAVNIRFYFDPADSTIMQDSADAYSALVRRTKGSVVWFKTDDQFSNGQIDASNGLSDEGGYTVMTPAGYGTESSLHYVQFNNIASFSGGGLGVGINGSLPVEWNDFSVSLQTDGSQLNWSTNLEQNSDFFAVERSVDGQVYETLGTVKAAGTTNIRTDYQYIDGGVWQIQEPRVYYRLRQVDVDGSVDYSNVVELNLNEAIGLGLEVYPNPASGAFNLNVSGEQGRKMQISVKNALGQTVYSRELIAPGSVFTLEIEVQKWPAGVYHVSVQQEGVKKTMRLVVE